MKIKNCRNCKTPYLIDLFSLGKISFTGKFSKGIGKNNTVYKLLNLLEQKNIIKNKKFEIIIKKNIPQKSGMGGGSMNAANLLNTNFQ